ncbi:MAG: hypothetical protein M0R47_03305 [Methylobacter sp.]|uniref:hypothetical protein n=1 Tax=Methylobacter sp. TaxID=2051955 RepID=UPI0025CF7534|nr:hypothetical protein [Methylobacter sp.]MCK9619542.1 hypothetical protein [Methylobacter sp.]
MLDMLMPDFWRKRIDAGRRAFICIFLFNQIDSNSGEFSGICISSFRIAPLIAILLVMEKTKSYQEQQEWARHNQAHFIDLRINLAAIIKAQLTLVICCWKSACEKTVSG